MEGEAGYYFDGTRSSEIYDYDNDYMENGVSYLIREETKTTKYVFGVAWIENVTVKNNWQTWYGADPTIFKKERGMIIMGKSLKNKMKNVGNFISETIVDVGEQVKDSEILNKISKGTKDGLGIVSKKVKYGAERFSEGTKTSVDVIKNAVSGHKKQGTQDVTKSKDQDDKKEKKIGLDDQLHNAVNRYNAAYAEFENNGSEILRQRERSVDLLENVENLVNSIANHPKNFDTDFKEIQFYKKEFKDVCDYAKKELDAVKKSMAGVGAGVAGGMAVASLAPSAAMWVATTFGTAFEEHLFIH